MQKYKRGNTWLSAQEARKYDQRGGITVVEPNKEVVTEAVIQDKTGEVSAETARDIPVDVDTKEVALANLEDVAPIELPKEVPSKKSKKK